LKTSDTLRFYNIEQDILYQLKLLHEFIMFLIFILAIKSLLLMSDDQIVHQGENNRNVHRLDILWPLVQILQSKSVVYQQ